MLFQLLVVHLLVIRQLAPEPDGKRHHGQAHGGHKDQSGYNLGGYFSFALFAANLCMEAVKGQGRQNAQHALPQASILIQHLA